MKLVLKFVVLGLVSLYMVGCTTVARQMGSITANKYAEPRSGSVWVVPPPQLEPPAASDRVVYISYRNISDADVDLSQLLRDSAKDQGWTVTRDPNEATYRLRASTRFFGEVKPESGGASVGRTMGVIAGAAAGVGTGVAVARSTDSALGGAVAGGAVGGLAGLGISNGSKPREWAMITDIILEERLNKPVKFTINTGSGSGTNDGAGSSNSRMASGGGTSSSNSSAASATKTSNYFPHGVRLSVWANQMNMSQEEAMPEIEKRTRKVVTQMLPL